MSEPSVEYNPSRAGRLLSPMVPRSPDEEHRAATPLELFFDLVFVVAIAQAAAWLHHELADGHHVAALTRYAVVFFAIWWAWMNFTWFASAYDNGDVGYRIAVLVQMSGALILAAGSERALRHLDFTLPVLGYVVMRIALVALWLRAARNDVRGRRTALRYAIGVTVCQVGWVAWWLAGAPGFPTSFLLLAAAELAVPVWAERAGPTPWHPEHIVERYGLLTIIVLGESILAATGAIATAAADQVRLVELAPVCVGGLLIVFSIWWFYFARPSRPQRESLARAIGWGYGHLVLYASAAAIGAGLGVVIDIRSGHGAIGPAAAGATVAIPTAICLLCIWALHARPGEDPPLKLAAGPIFAGLVLATPLTPWPVLATGLLTATLLATRLAERADAPREHDAATGEQARGGSPG